MKGKIHIFSLFLVVSLLLTTVFQSPACVKAKGDVKKTKYYTISKEAGTYTSAIKVKVKAKKGYRVYYKISGKFKKRKVIKGGKSKVFKINKTTVLSLCAVKKSEKVTSRKLNTVFRKKKKAYYAKYKYKISNNSNVENLSGTTNPTITGNPSVTASPDAAMSSVTALPDNSAYPGNTTTPSVNETPPSGSMIPGNSPSGTATADPEGKSEAQDKLNEADSQLAVSSSEPITKEPSVVTDDTPVITLTSEGITTANLEDDGVDYADNGNLKTITINKAGTYVLMGGTTAEPITNTEIIVAGNISDEVNLIWDSLIIDNSALGRNDGEDVPVFYVNKSTSDVHVTLKGSSVFTGNGAYTENPAAAIICADGAGTSLTFSAYEGDNTASLTVLDGMSSDTDFGSNDPSDGIYSKGTLALDSGTFSVKVNGDCLKGTGKDGEGGICINSGAYTLQSNCGNALKSKNGNILIHGGMVQSTYTDDDGINAKNYDVIITGGTIDIDQCYGDGIQGENVNISGDDTVINIKTYFENAGVNYYDAALGSGNYNIMTSTNSTKTEIVNVDTGSHKGIKGGTKAHSFSYVSVEDNSDYTAGTAYTTEASGGIVISGGTIAIDTTNAGIKYNGNGGETNPGSSLESSFSDGSLVAANSDGQYIIGSPDDGIHSNNTCVIAGGTLNISSSDDGITGPAGVIIMNSSDITIGKCYEGIEGGEIIIGSSEGTDAEPAVKIYSDDDGVNAASKSEINYVYEDESEERYTKTEKASNNNTLKVLSGYLNVMIGDDESHSFSLSTMEGTRTTGSYTSDGDGIDCNGTFYAYGGTIVVFGAGSNENSPIDTDAGYYIGNGVTMLAVGKSGMVESPTGKEQPIVVYGGSSGGFGGMMPGQGKNQGSSSSLSANKAFAIMKENNVLLAMKPIKNYNYVLYSSPELENGTTYTLYSGGSVSGSLVRTDNSAHDYRYTEYDVSGASVLSTITAEK